MMKIWDNGVIRDMTPEEETEFLKPAPPPTPEDATDEDYQQVLDDLGVRLS